MTRRVERYEELAPLLSAQLRPGVLTNTMLKKEDYQREIAAGALWIEELPDGLLLLRRREGFRLLNFYLQKGAEPPKAEPGQTTVMEIAARPRDKALRESLPLWEAAGYQPVFARQRMARPAGTPVPTGPEGFSPRVAETADLDEIESLLTGCFDPLTGCLPTRETLAGEIAEGHFLLVPGGLLHLEPAPGGTQLRHLAVAPHLRRQGAAQALFGAYMERTALGLSRVWVRTDNLPAVRFYEKNGYTPDGWTSQVLIAK